MSAYNFNPDLCLEVFHGIAEKIALGVRYGNVIALFFVEILCNGSSDFILYRRLGVLLINYRLVPENVNFAFFT